MQAEVALPDEIRLMIFKNCDISSLKTLRLVSRSWAKVGLDALLLPKFVISPARCDIQRLLNISQHPTLSLLAIKTIKTLEFIGNDWDITIFRNIFSNRVESTSDFRANSFVPTKTEQEALDELDIYEANMIETETDYALDNLVSALKAVPNYHKIVISTQCVFKHKLLKKTWAEYAPGLCIKSSFHPQVSHILSAVSQANLLPKHLIIEELSSRFALTIQEDFADIIGPALRDIETLSLKLEDLGDVMSESPSEIYTMIRSFLLPTPNLKSLTLQASAELELASILPTPPNWPHLESLHLSGEINGKDFLKYLGNFKPTLKRLQLMGMRMTRDSIQWKEFLTILRDTLQLERFQLAYSIWHPGGDDDHQQAWHLQPHCYPDWRVVPRAKQNKSWLLEKFVVEGGYWPMTETDDGAQFL